MQHAKLNKSDETSVEEYMRQHIGLAISIASKYYNRGTLDREDLKQEAMYGLYLATMRYEPKTGFKFSTFAVPTINGTVLKYIRDKESLIRVPRQRKTDFYKFKALGVEIGEAEAHKELEHTPEDIRELARVDLLINQVSLNQQIQDNMGSSIEIMDLIESEVDMEEETISNMACKEIKAIVYDNLGGECLAIVEMMSEGYRKVDIRRELDLSTTMLASRVGKIQDILLEKWL